MFEERLHKRPSTDVTESKSIGAKVLVVEDLEQNRDMLVRRLQRKGYVVFEAVDGIDGLEKIAELKPDVVLLDVHMPRLDGFGVINSARLAYTVAELPIIMTTAADESEHIVQAMRAGANDYVTKPIDFPVLLARMETQLQLKKAREEAVALAGQLESRNRLIIQLFGRYMSDELVASILAEPERMELGGSRRTVTMMMSDLRGFTPIVERLPPELVVELINNYLAEMTGIIFAHGGVIDEIAGDSIFALFGALDTDENLRTQAANQADRAVACALAMQAAMPRINQWNREHDLPELEMGIGINTGEVVIGNIGSDKRMKFSCVGRQVILVSRMESCTVGGQVLMSEGTRATLSQPVAIHRELSLSVKGFDEPVQCWEVSPPHATTTEAEVAPVTGLALPVHLTRLDHKQLSDSFDAAVLTAIIGRDLHVRLESPLPVLTDVRVRVVGESGREVFAKLTHHAEPDEGGHSVFRVTSSLLDLQALAESVGR